jgi:hypothetical protein
MDAKFTFMVASSVHTERKPTQINEAFTQLVIVSHQERYPFLRLLLLVNASKSKLRIYLSDRQREA